MKKESTYYKFTTKFIMTVLILFAGFQTKAQYTTTIELIDGAPDKQIKTAIEKTGGLLLTELNNAQGQKRALSLKGIDVDAEAASSLMTMWEICPFRCDELEIVERCLKTYSGSGGYQIRNIPVIMEPRKGERFNDDKYQQIVLNFDNNGKLKNLNFALQSTIYTPLMNGGGKEVTDFRERSMVIEFVEQFRTAYNRKDLSFLTDIYSDDALIITGKVERVPKMSDSGVASKSETKVTYSSQSKKEYLARLANVFKTNDRINVVFEDIKINKHREKKIYGVKLVQHWNSGSYSDVGYLFLLWDFRDEQKPMIHVRTWQPYKETPKEDLFDLGDFKIQ